MLINVPSSIGESPLKLILASLYQFPVPLSFSYTSPAPTNLQPCSNLSLFASTVASTVPFISTSLL